MNPVESFSDPLVFEPVYQTRVWGGRELENALGRQLPDPEQPYGESWEISDRPEAQSRIVSGPESLIGKTLGEIWQSDDEAIQRGIFGENRAVNGEPFPLLCKILDARARLSLQVHPPASVAAELDGEPKTEMWVVAHADPGAELIVGVKDGVSREEFEAALADGSAETLVHTIRAAAGDFIFIPSGRLHAIGAGLLIYEIQQNSDTTYRVFDWNRVGLDGQPRQLHIDESLKCIDFDDVEPDLDQPEGNLLVECDHFRVERHRNSVISLPIDRPAIVTVIEGPVRLGESGPVFNEGDFFLVPAAWNGAKRLVAEGDVASVMVTTWP
ncbi:MAG: class I mannose-6-phosphate isomerase [Verrucomicrobiae bacterium]|nr:class I mannose-6-phosphate isomerase [Verrucomicrobiae bacterium]